MSIAQFWALFLGIFANSRYYACSRGGNKRCKWRALNVIGKIKSSLFFFLQVSCAAILAVRQFLADDLTREPHTRIYRYYYTCVWRLLALRLRAPLHALVPISRLAATLSSIAEYCFILISRSASPMPPPPPAQQLLRTSLKKFSDFIYKRGNCASERPFFFNFHFTSFVVKICIARLWMECCA